MFEEIEITRGLLLVMGLTKEASLALTSILCTHGLTPEEYIGRVVRLTNHIQDGDGTWVRPVGMVKREVRLKLAVPLRFKLERLGQQHNMKPEDVLYHALGRALRQDAVEGWRPSEEPPLLVLDLDQTIVGNVDASLIKELEDEASAQSAQKIEHFHSFEKVSQRKDNIYLKRPGLDAFVARMESSWRLAVWSATSPERIEKEVEALGLAGNIEFMYSLQECHRTTVTGEGLFGFSEDTLSVGGYKDLWRLSEEGWGTPGKMLLLDDCNIHLPYQWSCIWQISPFWFWDYRTISPEVQHWEQQLLELADHLVAHAAIEDVRFITRTTKPLGSHVEKPFDAVDIWVLPGSMHTQEKR